MENSYDKLPRTKFSLQQTYGWEDTPQDLNSALAAINNAPRKSGKLTLPEGIFRAKAQVSRSQDRPDVDKVVLFLWTGKSEKDKDIKKGIDTVSPLKPQCILQCACGYMLQGNDMSS